VVAEAGLLVSTTLLLAVLAVAVRVMAVLLLLARQAPLDRVSLAVMAQLALLHTMVLGVEAALVP
jgi:hypothetical protein